MTNLKQQIEDYFLHNNFMIKSKNLSKKFNCSLNYTFKILRDLKNKNKIIKESRGCYYKVNENMKKNNKWIVK